MRQVPLNSNSYLIVGRGRLALNLAFYFKNLNIPYTMWHRDLGTETLKVFIKTHSRILLAISDGAIESFAKEHQLSAAQMIHFSGALITPFAHKLHPLMTFTRQPLALETWKSIPFIGTQGAPPLGELIPEFKNPFWQIPQELSALYHSLCVLSGNGTTVLWQNAFEQFENKLGLPREILHHYLRQICSNLIENSQNALTGPWARNDAKTIENNLNSLEEQKLYEAYSSLKNLVLKKSITSGGTYEVRP